MQARELVVEVMKEVQGLAKKDKNTSQGFNFRGIDAVMNVVGPALRKHGGFITPSVTDVSTSVATTKSGGSLNICRLQVTYSVFGSEGDPITGTVAAEAMDSGDKATAKAMSVAYRTFLLQLLCLPTDEPDPDSFSYELGAKADHDKLYILAGEQYYNRDIEGLRATFVKAQEAGLSADKLAKIQDWGKTLGNS
jgi:hypothetical protein